MPDYDAERDAVQKLIVAFLGKCAIEGCDEPAKWTAIVVNEVTEEQTEVHVCDKHSEAKNGTD